MFLLYYFIGVLLVNCFKSRQLSSENCDKVSEELSAQGVTFEEKFQLNNLESSDALCLHHGSGGSALSCCNRYTEKMLAEAATTEYQQIFLRETKTLSDTLARIHSHIHNITMQTIAEFGAKLEAFSEGASPATDLTRNRSDLIRRLLLTFTSFVNGKLSEKTTSLRSKEYIEQLIEGLVQTGCAGYLRNSPYISLQRTIRHGRRTNVPRLINAARSRKKFSGSEAVTEVGDALRALMAGLNVTRLFLGMMNASSDMVVRISQCRECTLSEECSTNVMRMNHCSYCAGEALIRPCFSVCLQVISGCIWRLQSLSGEWKNLFDISEKYFSKKRNQERLFKYLISVYVSIREKTAGSFRGRMKVRCYPDGNIHPFYTDSLRQEMRNLAAYSTYEARQIKLFWENLAVTMCTRSSWFSSLSHSLRCWNGSAMTGPQWHKCSFCQDRRLRTGHGPKAVTHSLREISSLSSDLSRVISSLPRHFTKAYRLPSLSDKDDFNDQYSEVSVKSKEEALQKNKTSSYKPSWKTLSNNNFIIFDDSDSSVKEDGSGQEFVSVKYATRTKLSITPQSLQTGQSMPMVNIFALLSAALSRWTLQFVILEGL